MIGRLIRARIASDEIATPCGQAIVEERYSALRRQIPIVYLLALVNFSGLELAISGRLALGLNLPTLLAVCAAVRIVQWLRPGEHVAHEVMLQRMRQTCWITALLCIVLCLWCVYLLRTGTASAQMAVILFGGLTGIGAAYGLSALPNAARMPLLFLALPLCGMAAFSPTAQVVGAALGLALVALLILRMLSVHHWHFTAVIRSRSTIAHQQELAEYARQEAILAATTDFLTGLPNRRAFVAALDAEIAGNRGDAFAVAVIDLDRFKAINDTFGHASGDSLLETVAERLVRAAPDGATVARLGGDEFGILFPDLGSATEAAAAGAGLMAEVNRPAMINGRQFAVSACCGFGMSRAGKTACASRVLADADLALYKAKDKGAGGVAVFEPSMEEPHRRRSQIERALLLPGVHESIHLVFQPIVDLRTGRVIVNEALARWRDPELGDVPPSEFVPIAEQLNLIGDISNHLMHEAFAEASEWPNDVRLSFNLSAVQLCSTGSADSILAAVRDCGLPPGRLQVEVTETALLADFERARENLGRLSSGGVTVVLDDFGAGYASIGYLREMRFDQIKLDGSLVTAAEDNAEGERLLAAVIGLCNALGVSTIAEHIESERQLQLLIKLGCDAGQGYWLQPPMPAEACRRFCRVASVLRPPHRGRDQRAA